MASVSSASAHRAVSETVHPGEVIVVGNFRLIVPPRGSGVGAEALLATGGERSVSVQTLRDGSVVTHVGPSRATATAAPPGTPFDKCADRGFVLNNSHWNWTYRWRFRVRSTPRGVKGSAARRALRRAVATIGHGRNACGMADRISATAAYLGRTNRHSNIGASSNCTSPDGRSVVSFGRLDPSQLSFTCWWMVGNHSVEADIEFNKTNYDWTTHWRTGCAYSWSIRAVATHEFGHAFGLAHVTLLHPNQTMNPLILPCQNSQATLGRGDVLGLRAKYWAAHRRSPAV